METVKASFDGLYGPARGGGSCARIQLDMTEVDVPVGGSTIIGVGRE